MNTNDNQRTVSDVNVDVYEDKAINRSKMARNVAIGAAVVGGVGVAATAAAATVAANEDPAYDEILEDDTLTVDDLTDGASIGEAPVQEVEVVHVSQSAPAPVHTVEPTPVEPQDDNQITWDETQELYVDGQKVMSMESGTLNGQKFALMDADGDNIADAIGIDINHNGAIEENEIFETDPSDRLAMGNPTAHSKEIHMFSDSDNMMAYNSAEQQQFDDNAIHNDFMDEKTGERYYGDYAENNPDYNPNAHYAAGMDLSEEDSYYTESTVAEGYAEADIDTPEVDSLGMDTDETFLA